ncbi:MAG: serine/threonine protein kinase, partial [Planctomycetales bacterium]|nr:serine/threonine protein kinase [Planctomycetales bacterium]
MSENQIDELLVDWELSRQENKELSPQDLSRGDQNLEQQLAQKIQVLRQTSWMLRDPAAETVNASEEANASLEQLKRSLVSHSLKVERASVEGTNHEVTQVSDLEKFQADIRRESEFRESVLQQDAIPGFQLLDEIGRGGFGVVYRARDQQLNRRVAIKIPLTCQPRTKQAYLSEARNAASLDIPGIVPVYQVGMTANDLPFVVQKLIDGQSLAYAVRQGGELSEHQAVQIMIAISEAAGAAHAKSLVHRDLKPANILIDREGKPWITDFGLALSEEEQAGRRGEVAGTPTHMAPEQLKGKADWLDGRTDIWALGVILYELLTGKLPFYSKDRAELFDQILNRDPRPISQRAPHLSRHWD